MPNGEVNYELVRELLGHYEFNILWDAISRIVDEYDDDTFDDDAQRDGYLDTLKRIAQICQDIDA